MITLGRGSVYEVVLRDRFSSASVSTTRALKANIVRARKDYSTHAVTMLPVPELAAVRAWAWTVEIVREGVRESIGPVTTVAHDGTLVRIAALCNLGWANVRRMRTTRTLTDIEPAAALAIVLADALGYEADPIEYGLPVASSDERCDLAWTADQGIYASQLVEQLWDTTGLDGGTMRDGYAVPSTVPVARLTPASFLDGLGVIYDGMSQATNAFVRGLSESTSYPPGDPVPGRLLVDYTVDRNTAKTAGAVRAAARLEYERRSGSGARIGGPGGSGARVSPASNLDPAVCAPGAVFEVVAQDSFGRDVSEQLAVDEFEVTIGSDTNPARSPGGKFASDAQVATEFATLRFAT